MLTNIQKRFLLFLSLCIPIRLAIAVTSKHYGNLKTKVELPIIGSIKIIRLLGYLALCPIIGWLYITFISPRKTGPETFGDKIWWNNIRPIHILLYIAFAYLALSNNLRKESKSWIPLFVDALLGLVSFFIYHWSSGSLAKLI